LILPTLNKILYFNKAFKNKGHLGGALKLLLAASSEAEQKTCFD